MEHTILRNYRLWIKAGLIFLGVLLVFSIAVWPTVYDYRNRERTIRVGRLTHIRELYNPTGGWRTQQQIDRDDEETVVRIGKEAVKSIVADGENTNPLLLSLNNPTKWAWSNQEGSNVVTEYYKVKADGSRSFLGKMTSSTAIDAKTHTVVVLDSGGDWGYASSGMEAIIDAIPPGSDYIQVVTIILNTVTNTEPLPDESSFMSSRRPIRLVYEQRWGIVQNPK